MTATIENQPALLANPSECPVPCLTTLLRIVDLDSGQALRRQLAGEVFALHTRALANSMVAEAQGYLPDVELPDVAVTPKIIGPEVICLMSLARKRENRQLAPHPDDPSKRIITVRQ